MLINHGDVLRVPAEHSLRLALDGGHNQQVSLTELTERCGRQRKSTLNCERTACLTEAINTEALPAGTTECLRCAGQDLKRQGES